MGGSSRARGGSVTKAMLLSVLSKANIPLSALMCKVVVEIIEVLEAGVAAERGHLDCRFWGGRLAAIEEQPVPMRVDQGKSMKKPPARCGPLAEVDTRRT